MKIVILLVDVVKLDQVLINVLVVQLEHISITELVEDAHQVTGQTMQQILATNVMVLVSNVQQEVFMIVLNVIWPMDGISKMMDNVLNHVQLLITETFLQENVRVVTQVVKHVLINMTTPVQAVPLENTYTMVIV